MLLGIDTKGEESQQQMVSDPFVRSIYTNDPDGTFVEWTYNVRALTKDDRIEAERLLLDDSSSDQPGEAAIFHTPAVAV